MVPPEWADFERNVRRHVRDTADKNGDYAMIRFMSNRGNRGEEVCLPDGFQFLGVHPGQFSAVEDEHVFPVFLSLQRPVVGSGDYLRLIDNRKLVVVSSLRGDGLDPDARSLEKFDDLRFLLILAFGRVDLDAHAHTPCRNLRQLFRQGAVVKTVKGQQHGRARLAKLLRDRRADASLTVESRLDLAVQGLLGAGRRGEKEHEKKNGKMKRFFHIAPPSRTGVSGSMVDDLPHGRKRRAQEGFTQPSQAGTKKKQSDDGDDDSSGLKREWGTRPLRQETRLHPAELSHRSEEHTSELQSQFHLV